MQAQSRSSLSCPSSTSEDDSQEGQGNSSQQKHSLSSSSSSRRSVLGGQSLHSSGQEGASSSNLEGQGLQRGRPRLR